MANNDIVLDRSSAHLCVCGKFMGNTCGINNLPLMLHASRFQPFWIHSVTCCWWVSIWYCLPVLAWPLSDRNATLVAEMQISWKYFSLFRSICIRKMHKKWLRYGRYVCEMLPQVFWQLFWVYFLENIIFIPIKLFFIYFIFFLLSLENMLSLVTNLAWSILGTPRT